MHYSPYFRLLIIMAWVYFSQPQVPKPVPQVVAKPECPLLWVTLNVQLRHICQPQTWSHQDSQDLGILDSHLPFGAAPPGFQPGLAAWRNSLSSILPTFPFTVCKPRPFARGMVLVALTVEYQECLKVGPFWCALLMHLFMVALWLFNKDEVCWHILLTSITYLPLQRRCVECSSFIIFS